MGYSSVLKWSFRGVRACAARELNKSRIELNMQRGMPRMRLSFVESAAAVYRCRSGAAPADGGSARRAARDVQRRGAPHCYARLDTFAYALT